MFKKVLKFGGLSLLILAIIAAAAILYLLYHDTQNPYLGKSGYVQPKDEDIPKFKEIQIDFKHQFDTKKDLPLMATALIDFDGDGTDEIFIGGGDNQKDALFKFKDGAFENISEQVGFNQIEKTYTLGAVSFDLDEDGKTDLILTRNDGVFLLKNDGKQFTRQRLNINPDDTSNPASVTVGDYDKDGDADIFLCNYIKKETMTGQTIFNDLNYGANSQLLRNDGNLKFTDVTEAVKLSYTHNSFQAVFVDVDEDMWLDLVVAYDTGRPKIYRNDGGKSFTEMPTPMSDKFGYPMGIAVGDYNNDGKIDFFFSNTGTSVPGFMAKGDLRSDQVFEPKWILWKNEGGFKFSDAAEAAQIADFEFSWGAVFEDFNLDGRQDLVVAENYIGFPGHQIIKLPGRFLIQRDDKTFAAVEDKSNVVNKNYAITPLSSDFNNDGYPDLIYANLNGNFRAFINQGGKNKFVKVRFPEQSKYVGAKVEVKTKNGKSMSDVYVVGEGLASDNTNVLTFGLGEADEPASIIINYFDGEFETIPAPKTGEIYLAGTFLANTK